MFNFLTIFNSGNFDLLSVGVTIAAIAILGFLVYFSNRKSITNRTFLFLSLIDVGYAFFNYSSYHALSPNLALWLLRLVIFFAVWYSLALFHLVLVFPKNEVTQLPKIYKYVFLPIVILTSVLTLTPLVFDKISETIILGQVPNPERGSAIALFGIVIVTLVFGSIYLLGKKTIEAAGEEKNQFKLIWIGVILSYTLIVIFNFILPVIFNNLKFIPFAPVWTIFFIAFTAYAIIKHHLLNIKIIATEFLTFALAVATLFEILFSPNSLTAIFRFFIFLLILAIGILLDRSVRHEVEQREKLELLDKELIEANEKLKVLDQARADFITVASHQLRTPPATLKWFLSSLLAGDYGKISKEQRDILEKTNRTNNSQISLIDDMLNVSRIERGKMEFLFQPCDMLDLAKLTFEQLEPAAEGKGLKLIFNAPKKKLPVLMADKEKIRQVMNNLIDNSIKYTQTGSVTVSLTNTPDEIKFSVTDTGKGISSEDQGAIFEKYKRGKESVKHSAGLGLGLYVAKVIIDQHKGKIWAESPGEGKGSSFIFTVPINNGLKETTLVDLAVQKNTK